MGSAKCLGSIPGRIARGSQKPWWRTLTTGICELGRRTGIGGGRKLRSGCDVVGPYLEPAPGVERRLGLPEDRGVVWRRTSAVFVPLRGFRGTKAGIGQPSMSRLLVDQDWYF